MSDLFPEPDPRRAVAAEIIGGWLRIEPFCCDDLVDQILEAIDAAETPSGHIPGSS